MQKHFPCCNGSAYCILSSAAFIRAKTFSNEIENHFSDSIHIFSIFSSATISTLAAPSDAFPDSFSLSEASISVLSFLTFFSSAEAFLATPSSFFSYAFLSFWIFFLANSLLLSTAAFSFGLADSAGFSLIKAYASSDFSSSFSSLAYTLSSAFLSSLFVDSSSPGIGSPASG